MRSAIVDFLWNLLGIGVVAGVFAGLGVLAWYVMDCFDFDPQDVWEGEEE